MKLFRKSVSIFLALLLMFSSVPVVGVFAESEWDAVNSAYELLYEQAYTLLFSGNSEQSSKYLFDRVQRAEAVFADEASDITTLNTAVSELQNAIDSLAPMKGLEKVKLNSFDSVSDADIFALVGSTVGVATIEASEKPEEVAQAICLEKRFASFSDEISFSNFNAGVMVGTNPFGVDITDTDGLRLWVSTPQSAKLQLTVGKHGAGDDVDYTTVSVNFEGTGYISVPYYVFNNVDDPEFFGGGLNYFKISATGTDKILFADLNAYREVVEISNPVEYTEERIMSRSGIVDNAYYKIYDASSYDKGILNAVTLGPVPDETALLWDGAVSVEASNMKFTIEESVQGELSQLWQLSADPSNPTNVRIINKASACAMTMSSSGGLSYRQFDYNDATQEFQLSATKGQFTIQVKNNGKLTFSGETVKGTTGSTYKKFVLVRVHDGEYTQTWSDEFDGTELDRSIWSPDNGFFFGGGNSGIYVDNDRTVSVKDGKLVLKTLYGDNNGYQSTANQLKTNGKYAISYGRVEISAKMPQGFGMWPALWLMPTDSMNMARSEIDIMEMPVLPDNYKSLGDKLYAKQIGTFHWASNDGTTQWSKPVEFYNKDFEPMSTDYHTYAVEIDTDQVRMYFDGALYNVLNLCNDELRYAYGDINRYLILSSGGIQGDGSCVLYEGYEYNDIEMDVDYVRCYIRSEQATGETVDYTTDESTQVASSVEYSGKRHNTFMYNFPMAVSPDGTQAVLADQAGFLCAFDPRTNEHITTVSTGSYKAYLSAAYSPDGSKVAIATMSGSILIFDTSDYTATPVRIHNGATLQYCLSFTKDSQHLIVGGFSGGAENYKNPINGKNVSPHYVRVFNPTTGAVEQELFVESDPLAISLTEDGGKFAVATTSKGIFIFNTLDWSLYANFTDIHENTLNDCEFSADGKLLATSDEAGKVVIWDIASKTALRTLKTASDASVKRIAFSPDGKNIVTTSLNNAARLFNVETGRCISILGGFKGIIDDVAYSPNGKYIVVASLDHTMKVFSANGTYLETLVQSDELDSEGHISSRICFTPDSKYVLCTDISMPKTINRWELPVDTDAYKAELGKAIEENLSARALPSFKNALKVYNLKYATPSMIISAINRLRGLDAADTFGVVNVSADGSVYSATADIFKNGYVYIKADIFKAACEISCIIDNIDGDNDFVILARSIRRGYESSSVDYNTWNVVTHLDEAGTYEIYFAEYGTSNYSAKVRVNVSSDETTRDFVYTINPDNTVTINSTKNGICDIYIPDYIDGYPVTKIADYAFSNYGDSVAKMTLRLPSTLKEIGNYSFYQCSTLEHLVLPEGLEKIGTYAFGRCLMLDSVEIPESVISIGSYAFYYVRGLLYAKVGAGTKSVPSTIFSMGIGNRAYIFAEGIESIGANVADRANLVERVYIPKSATSVSVSMLYSTNKNIKVYGYVGTAAETYANSKNFTFVPLAAPVISGVSEGETYDVFEGEISATWDDAHIAYLNGEQYRAGTPITEPGEYTLTVINGYDEFTTKVKFNVVDTTPPPYKLGDLDEDGEITVTDALIVLRFAAKLTTPEGNQLLAADVDKDEKITVTDALMVLRVAAKLANF